MRRDILKRFFIKVRGSLRVCGGFILVWKDLLRDVIGEGGFRGSCVFIWSYVSLFVFFSK